MNVERLDLHLCFQLNAIACNMYYFGYFYCWSRIIEYIGKIMIDFIEDKGDENFEYSKIT
ncbi:hypothetical protein HPP92_008923 [Vanilla planifolia]|uniref:Uncharacterized protein n=1 Tax=Vanilla planifolia TaxID=51239 RepID=A0A835RI99_VANPL|nr:hypothetical protein HPP92_008923 [Vanilla planifolia]